MSRTAFRIAYAVLFAVALLTAAGWVQTRIADSSVDGSVARGCRELEGMYAAAFRGERPSAKDARVIALIATLPQTTAALRHVADEFTAVDVQLVQELWRIVIRFVDLHHRCLRSRRAYRELGQSLQEMRLGLHDRLDDVSTTLGAACGGNVERARRMLDGDMAFLLGALERRHDHVVENEALPHGSEAAAQYAVVDA